MATPSPAAIYTTNASGHPVSEVAALTRPVQLRGRHPHLHRPRQHHPRGQHDLHRAHRQFQQQRHPRRDHGRRRGPRRGHRLVHRQRRLLPERIRHVGLDQQGNPHRHQGRAQVRRLQRPADRPHQPDRHVVAGRLDALGGPVVLDAGLRLQPGRRDRQRQRELDPPQPRDRQRQQQEAHGHLVQRHAHLRDGPRPRPGVPVQRRRQVADLDHLLAARRQRQPPGPVVRRDHRLGVGQRRRQALRLPTVRLQPPVRQGHRPAQATTARRGASGRTAPRSGRWTGTRRRSTPTRSPTGAAEPARTSPWTEPA